jgi:hypothetical protein
MDYVAYPGECEEPVIPPKDLRIPFLYIEPQEHEDERDRCHDP